MQRARFGLDQLPYTDEFDRLKVRFERAVRREVSNSQFWRILKRVGKRGGLSRKGKRVKVDSPPLSREQQLEIIRLLPDGTGSRDQLPYTSEFDRIHRQFNRHTKLNLDKREFWRVVSRVGKKSRKPQPIFEAAPLGGLPGELVAFLQDQNPWWSGSALKPTAQFRRWAFTEAESRLESGLTPIVAIRGPRQVGKTTIQEQLIEDLLRLRNFNPARILRVQFDDVPSLGSFKEPIQAIVRWFERNVLKDTLNAVARRNEPAYLFFDEVQNLRTWAPQLKSLVDHAAAKTLVTGSSALRIAQGQDSLAGRISMCELGPLRLTEIAGVRRLGKLPPFQSGGEIEEWTEIAFWLRLLKHAAKYKTVLKRSFELYSEFGGYPVCHKPVAKRPELSELITSMVVKRTLEHDLKAGPDGRYRDPAILEETFRQICRYAGQPVKPSRIKDEVQTVLGPGVKEKPVVDAVKFLADALLVHRVSPLEALAKKQSHPPKLCLCDHFIREAWLQEKIPIAPSYLSRAHQAVSTIAGHLIESDIGYFLKGICGLDVSWFPERNGEPEIDFVLTLGMQRLPIEVKYCRRRPTRNDLAGIKSFCTQSKYNAPFGLLITQDLAGQLDERTIAVPAYAFLAVR